MKRDYRTMSVVREKSPFATPPRVLVLADEGHAGEALALADAFDDIGADAEIRFGEEVRFGHVHPDAVIVTGTDGYRVARYHPVLEGVLHGGR